MLIVKVKWNKEIFEVDVDPSEDPTIFKAQMYALTNVPVDSQKIMIKGKVLKDNDDLSKLGLKNAMMVMMMGSLKRSDFRLVLKLASRKQTGSLRVASWAGY